MNEWRGRCLDVFARAETAVTECLVAMSAAGERGRDVGLPHLAGQRYEALAAMIGEGGPFAAEGVGVLGTLGRFRAHQHFRNVLAHSVGKVTLDRQGRWTVVLRLVSLRSGQVCREAVALNAQEAEELRVNVSRLGADLSSQLGQLRKRLTAG